MAMAARQQSDCPEHKGKAAPRVIASRPFGNADIK
jgi:hypothetical protein